MSRQSPHHRPYRRGIYFLPNLLTLAALFFGYLSVVCAYHGLFVDAAWMVLVAMIFDGLDGRIARLMGSQSEFGAQLDSLSDVICFGLAPAFMVYCWSLAYLGKLGWLMSFFYTTATALRLARFNAQAGGSGEFFQGLNTTVSAGFVASALWYLTDIGYTGYDCRLLAIIGLFVLALLKVSNIRYHSFKKINVRRQVPFLVILLSVLCLILLTLYPAIVLVMVGVVYILSGPICTLWQIQALKRLKRSSQDKTNV